MKTKTILTTLISRVSDKLLPQDSDPGAKNSKVRPLVIEALEPRILFSGSPAPAPAPEPEPVSQEAPAPAEAAPQADAPETSDANVATPPAATSEVGAAAEIATAPGDEVPAENQGVTAVSLTEAELDAIAEVAAQRWVASGISAEQTDALTSANYQIVDLSDVGGNFLGSAEGNLITIDDDAAGRGWFVDQTPDEDSEFSLDGSATSAAATTKIDLLSVLLHEQGHLLGLEDTSASDIMNSVFLEGERRLPEAGQAEGAVALSLEGVHFAEWATNGNANWNDDVHWNNPDTFPNAVDAVADFSKTNISNHRNINVETDITVGSLSLGDSSGGHTYRFYDGTAGTLTFDVSSGNATLSNNSGGTDSFNNTIILNDTLEISGGSLNFDNAATDISGTGGIIYNGTGTLSMRGSTAGQYSYTGPTVVNSGVYLGSHSLNGNLPANSNLQINEARYQGYYNSALIRPLGTGAGEFQLTGGTAAGFNYNNNLTIRFGNDSNTVVQWGSATFDPGTLLLGNTRTSGGGDGKFDNKLDLNGAARTFEVTAGHAGLEWVMQREILDTVGGASINKTGNGVLRLDAANTFTGGVTINGGTIRTNSAGALSSGNVVVEAGATLEINVAGAIDDAAVLTLNGAATGTLILNANETVGEFWVDGTQLAVGVYDSTYGLADSGGNPLISGTGTLTVLSGPAAPAKEINIKTNNDVGIADGDNSASIPGTDFGDVDTVAGSEVLTFKITNNGTGDLTLSAQPTVSDTTNYTVSPVTGGDLVLGAGETQTFTVTFDPDSGGAKPATVTVLSDDADEGTYTFGITGTGVVPQDAIWTLNNNGDWDVDGNWNPSAAFGIGSVADFSQTDITNHRNINVETGVTVGSILLGDASGGHTYRFNDGTAGTLTFDVVSGNATLSNDSGGTDSFNNTIILNDTLEISGGSLNFNNAATDISGTGGIIYNGTGTLVMNGSTTGQYSYTGDTVVNSGVYLGSHSNNGNLPAGNVQINEAIYQGYYNAGLIRPLGTGAGEFQLTGGTAAGFNYNNNLTIRFGNNANNVVQWGSATFDPGTLLLGNTRGSGGGDGNFDNKLDLNGAARTIEVTAGHAGLEWVMKQEILDTVGGASMVKTGNGVLRLNAANTFTGGVTINDGTIRTNSASALGSGDVDVENGGTLEIDVADAIDDAAMLNVNGTGKLILDANETVDQLWVDGTQLAAGNYDASSLDLDISGTGILTVVTGPSATTTTVELDGSGNLVITDTADKADDITISVVGTDYLITNSTDAISETFAILAVSGEIQVNTLGGDDSLTLDYGTGDITHDVTYSGGNPTTAPGDQLIVNGGTFATAAYNYTNANDGTIQLAGQGMITYTGLEPITSTINATDVTLTYNSTTAETITITQPSGTQTTVNSTAGEITTFTNPTNSLTINAASDDSVVDGGALTLAYDLTVASGDVDFSNALALGANTLTVDISGAGGTVTGAISGSGDLVKNGAGTLAIASATNANNAYSGDITVNGGVLQAGDTGAGQRIGTLGLGTKTITVNNGGTLRFSDHDTFGNAGVTPTNTIVINQGGLVTSENSFTVLGDIDLNGGTLATNGGANGSFQSFFIRGDVTVGGSSASSITSAGGNQGIHLSAATTFDIADVAAGVDLNATALFINQTGTQGGAAAGIVKTGAGQLFLGNAGSTFSGDLDIQGGTVRATAGHNNTANSSALGAAIAPRTITVGNGTTLEFSANDVFGNAASSPTAEIVVDGGTVTNTGNWFNTLGPLTLNGGNLNAVGGANGSYQAWRLFGDVTVGGTTASTITSTGSNSGVHLTTNTTFNVADATGDANPDLIISSALINQTASQGGAAGGLTKTGSGQLHLGNAGSTFSGDLDIQGGTVRATAGHNNTANSGALGAAIAPRTITVGNGTTLEFSANDVFGNAASSPTAEIVVNGGTVTNTGNWFNTLGPLTLNGGNLNAVGGANGSYQAWRLFGDVTVGGSTASTITSSGSNSGVQLNGTTTFTVADATGDSAADLIVSAPIVNQSPAQGSGPGNLRKNGGGTMALTGVGNSLGDVTSDGGVLSFEGASTTTISEHLRVGDTVTGTVEIKDTANVTVAKELLVGDSFGVAGNVDQTGGTLTVNQRARLGHWGGESSTYDISAGTFNMTGTGANTGLYVGWDGNGTLNASGTADINSTFIGVQNNSNFNISDSATVDLSGTFSIGDARGTGFVNQSGGTVTANGETRVAHWGVGANSQYNISGGTLDANGALSVGWDGGNAQMNVSGTGNVDAGFVRVQNNATLSIADSATVDANEFSIGDQRGTGFVNQTGGTATVNGLIRVGHWGAGANSQYNISGGLLDANGNLFVGWDGANAQMNVSGTGDVDAGFVGVQNNGTLSIADSATFDANEFSIGDQRGTGFVIQTGGTTTVNSLIRIGHWGAGANSQYNISGGTLDSNGTLAVGWDGGNSQMNVTGTGDVDAQTVLVQRDSTLTIADSSTFDGINLSVGDFRGNGTVTQNGGDVEFTNLFRIGHWPQGNNSAYNMNGGTLDVSGTPGGIVNPGGVGEQAGIIYLGVDGVGNFTQTGGDVMADGVVLDARGDSFNGTDTLSLNGGTMTLGANGIKSGNFDNNTTIQVNLGGGTLAASADWNSTLDMGITGAGGDSVVDTNGFNIGLSGNLSGGNLIKVDNGDLTLTGATNTFGRLDAAGGNLVLAGSSVTNVGSNTRVGVSPGSNNGLASSGSGTLTIQDTASLTSNLIYMGENNTPQVPGMTATINQTGGTVRTTGSDGEGNGIRIGHWPNNTSTYNLSGGDLIIDNGAELAIAIDGTGVFNQTGGTATAETVVVNARNNPNGNGTFTVEGGTFNVGAGGIVNEGSGPATVNFGGGTDPAVVATANWNSTLDINLSGAGSSAVSMDTNGFDVELSGVLSGAGGLDKDGAGTLTLSGDNTYGGDTNANAGTLLINGDHVAGAGVAVADYRDDFVGTTPAAGWHYLWNENGNVSDPANYSALLSTGTTYDVDGVPGLPGPDPGAWSFLGANGGHPGRSQGQAGSAEDRYVIAAYTVGVADDYALTDSFIDPINTAGEGNNVRVFVQSGGGTVEITSTAIDNSADSFNATLGSLSAGDVIYVASGPDGAGGGNNDGNDSFNWDFTIATVTFDTSSVNVASGAVLGGTGSTTSSVNVVGGGEYTPGADPNGNTTAQFGTGSFGLSAGSDFAFDLNGAAPGTEYDQTVVNGTVSLGDANFIFDSNGFDPAAGDVFVLINNDGTDAVSGTFLNLAEGAVVDDLANQNVYIISYKGGDGNDVVLLAQGPAEVGGSIVGGDLVIEDIEDTGLDDRLTITSDGTNIIVRDPNQILGVDFATGVIRPDIHTIIVPFALFDDIIVLTKDGEDVINVADLTNFDQSLTIDGGGTDGAVDFIDFRANALGASGESYDFDAEKILFYLDSSIAATGTGGIDIDATGGGTEDFIGLQLKRATLTSEGGDITLDGEGGSVGKNNDGVLLSHGSSVTTTDGGSVTITGTGTSAAGSNDGVSLLGGSDITVSGAGAIALTGEASGVSDSYGVQLFRGTTLASEDGDITLAGTSTATGARNSGIYTNTATVTTAGAGSIALDGEGSGSGSSSMGLRLAATEFTAAGTGGITLTGTGGQGTSSNVGVQVGVRTTLATASGDVTITGEGTGSTSKNAGVAFLSKSSVGSGGDLTVTGTAGDGTSHNDGVSLTSASLTATGDLTVTGTGKGSSSYNRGIDSTNSTFGGAGVTLAGTGSTGSASGRFNDGVYLNRGGATAAGTLTINATGGTGSSDNRGFYASRVDLAGTLAITGTADAATTGVRNTGVFVQNSTLAAGSITGTAGGGTGSFGAYMQNILGGLTSTSVTTNPLNDETERKGNFFPAILPLLFAATDRRKKSGGKDTATTLRALLDRIRALGALRDTADGETPVFRSVDGIISLDPMAESDREIDAALARAGIDPTPAPAGSRRALILLGDDHETLSGFFAFVEEKTDTLSYQPLRSSEENTEFTIGEFLSSIADSKRENRERENWSAPLNSIRPAHRTSHSLSEVFGLI